MIESIESFLPTPAIKPFVARMVGDVFFIVQREVSQSNYWYIPSNIYHFLHSLSPYSHFFCGHDTFNRYYVKKISPTEFLRDGIEIIDPLIERRKEEQKKN